MTIIETIKKVNGNFFKGNITKDQFEFTQFINHTPAVQTPRQPQSGYANYDNPVSFNKFIRCNFAILTIEQLDEMITELDTIRRELAK